MQDLIPTNQIERAIFVIRGPKVMLDVDLALIYGVPTKVLNQAVKAQLAAISLGFCLSIDH
jgi:ORF6N domain-containing protein